MRRPLILVAIAAALSTLPACGKGADAAGSPPAAVEEALGKDAVIVEFDAGSAAWSVGADGQVKALVLTPDGKPVKENVSGSLAWKDGAETKTIPLAADAKTGTLVAAGPKLSADLTEIGYTLSVSGKPWSGTLHVPAGGTAELAADAKASADVTVPEGKLGPHGGTIQIVGKDRLELVADEVSGEVRVYLLDANFEAVALGDRKITLGLVADKPEVVVLVAEPGGMYAKGKLHISEDPFEVTIAVRAAEHVSVVLVGYRPGARVVVRAGAPRLKVRVKAGFDVKEDAEAEAKVKVHGPDVDVKAKGPGVDVKVKGPDVKVKGPDVPDVKAKAKGKAGIDVKVKAKL